MAASVDQPIAALLRDLKSRGLAEDTLVIWTTEFGRTPFAQGSLGRDHNGGSFVTWLWGAGIKPGVAHGRSDDWGYQAAEGTTYCYDLHATVLHLLGIDHTSSPSARTASTAASPMSMGTSLMRSWRERGLSEFLFRLMSVISVISRTDHQDGDRRTVRRSGRPVASVLGQSFGPSRLYLLRPSGLGTSRTPMHQETVDPRSKRVRTEPFNCVAAVERRSACCQPPWTGVGLKSTDGRLDRYAVRHPKIRQSSNISRTSFWIDLIPSLEIDSDFGDARQLGSASPL